MSTFSRRNILRTLDYDMARSSCVPPSTISTENKLFKEYLFGFFARCFDNPLFIPPYLEDTAFAQLLKEQYSIYTAARDLVHLSGKSTTKRHFSSRTTTTTTKPSSEMLMPVDRSKTADQSINKKDQQRVPSDAQYEALKELVMEDDCMPLIVKDYRLPTGWHRELNNKNVDVSLDGLEVHYRASSKDDTEIGTVRGNHAVKRQCGIFYYEIEVLSKTFENDIGIGFSKKPYNFDRFPGWEADSWGFHGENGKLYAGPGFGISYGPKWGSGDIVGCGMDYRDMSIFYTKNGRYLGKAFSKLKDIDLYPIVGMRTPERIEANFGHKPFKFDIREYVANGKTELIRDIMHPTIRSTSATIPDTNIRDSYVFKTRTDEVVMEYLLHNGYDETARVLSRSLNIKQDVDETTKHKDVEICKLVIAGDIDRAIEMLREHYPDVLNHNLFLLLKLKCRKLIEMARRAQSDVAAQAASTSSTQYSNTEYQTDNLRVSATTRTGEKRVLDMGRLSRENEHKHKRQKIANEERTQPIRLQDVVAYGMSLRQEYQYFMTVDPRYYKELMSAFSTLAYPDLSHPAVAHLYSKQHVESIASEVNSAILVSLGEYPTSSLERIYRQTSLVLRDLIIAGNGKASLIKLEEDCLH